MSTTTVCIVGGGPAGVMAGLLLARQGIPVTVLEKHDDFLRDFRGDTIHPSTLALLHELGLLEEFLERPHSRMERVGVRYGGTDVTLADFRRLPGPARFIAFMPQWHFLDFLTADAERSDGFTLRMGAEATGFLRDADGRVQGVRWTEDGSTSELRADLVIAADGRNSALRDRVGLVPRTTGPTMELLWFRLPRTEGERLPLFTGGRGALICLDRGDYWQVAYVFAPGGAERLRAAGLPAMRERVAELQPMLRSRLERLESWDELFLLRTRTDRLRRWHSDGLLSIGDAAHAMSPAGGVGINLAIQDAVATARILGPELRAASSADEIRRIDLDAIRRRREWPVRVTQAFQGRLAHGIVASDERGRSGRAPLPLRLIGRVPGAAHLMGRFIGLGVRPERFGSR